MHSKTKLKAGAGLILAPMIWGFAFVVVKDTLNYIPVIYMLAFRFSIASLALVPVLFKRLRKYLTFKSFLAGVFLGVLVFSSYLVQTYGCLYTTASKNAFITATYVVMTPFLLWIIDRKKPEAKSFIASALCVAGLALLSLTEGISSVNIGDFLSLICALGFAVHLIFVNRFTQKYDPLVLTFVQLAVAALLSWVFAPFIGGAFPTSALLNPGVVMSMLYLGLMSTMLCYILQNTCQKYLPATTASLLLSTEAVFGTIFSVLILGDVFNGRMVIGCLLIFAAIILAQTKLKFLPFGGPRNA